MLQNVKPIANSDLGGMDISSRLLARKAEIIQLWKDRLSIEMPPARNRPDPLLSEALPDWLDRVVSALASADAPFLLRKVAATALEQKKLRAQAELDLGQLLYEYIVLQKVILDVLDRETIMAPRQRDIILDAVQLSMRDVAEEHGRTRRRRLELVSLTKAEHSLPNKLLLSLLIVSGATALQWIAWPIVQPFAYFFFYPTIIIAALVGNATFAIILSIALAHYFFVLPRFSLAISGWPEAVRILTFAATSFAISKIIAKLKITQKLTDTVLAEHDIARRDAEFAAGEAKKARAEAEHNAHILNQESALRERFVATLSHDLRGPLTSARASIQLLQRSPDKIELRERLLILASDGIDRTNRMIEDLLDANRIHAGQGIPLEMLQCDIAQTIQYVIEELTATHGDRFIFNSPEQILGYWNRDGLFRLVENLCNNAIKYGAPDSAITIELKRVRESVLLSVHNFGSFIPPDQREDLFNLFQRSASAEVSGKRGWGIGLTIVQGITEAHRGRITLTSDPTNGTTFAIELPMDARPPATLGGSKWTELTKAGTAQR